MCICYISKSDIYAAYSLHSHWLQRYKRKTRLAFRLKRSVATPLEVTLFATCLIQFEVSKNLDHNPALTMTHYKSAVDLKKNYIIGLT